MYVYKSCCVFPAAIFECDWRTTQYKLSDAVWLSRPVCLFGGEMHFPHSKLSL